MKPDGDQPFNILKTTGELSVIGLTMVFATGIGFYLGSRVENYWPTIRPWGGAVGALLGVVAGFMEMIRTVQRAMRKINEMTVTRPPEKQVSDDGPDGPH